MCACAVVVQVSFCSVVVVVSLQRKKKEKKSPCLGTPMQKKNNLKTFKKHRGSSIYNGAL